MCVCVCVCVHESCICAMYMCGCVSSTMSTRAKYYLKRISAVGRRRPRASALSVVVGLYMYIDSQGPNMSSGRFAGLSA